MIVGAMQRAATDLKLPPRSDESIRELIGLGLNEALASLYPDMEPAHLYELLQGYRAQWLSEGTGEAPLFEGTMEAMQSLSDSGYLIAIATGKSRKGLDRSLRHHSDLRNLVLTSRTADETASKPNPLMLKELLVELDVRAEEALMVGDTEYDMAMARAIIMPGLGVTCGVHAPQRMLDAGAAALLERVQHLPDWLKS